MQEGGNGRGNQQKLHAHSHTLGKCYIAEDTQHLLKLRFEYLGEPVLDETLHNYYCAIIVLAIKGT